MKEDYLKYYREYRKNVIIEKKETLLQMVRRVVKEGLQYESFDGGYYTFIKEDSFKYHILNKEEEKIATCNFRLSYDFYKLNGFELKNINYFYEVSWGFVNDEMKSPNNWMRVTGVIFKIMGDFIDNVKPNLIYFSSEQYTKTDKIYSNNFFKGKIISMFSPKYYYMNKTDSTDKTISVCLVKMEYTTHLDPIVEKTIKNNPNLSENKIYKDIFYRKKNNVKGVLYKERFNEQLERIINRSIYLWKNNI